MSAPALLTAATPLFVVAPNGATPMTLADFVAACKSGVLRVETVEVVFTEEEARKLWQKRQAIAQLTTTLEGMTPEAVSQAIAALKLK